MEKIYGVVDHSDLLGSKDNLIWILTQTLKKTRVVSVTSLFNSREHGFKLNDFHSLVDGQGPQFTLMKSKAGKVFGGFTMKHWQSPWLAGYVGDPEAFLFSLDLQKKYRIQNSSQAIYVSGSYGPIFGNKDLEFKANLSKLNEENGCYCYTGHPESVYKVPNDEDRNNEMTGEGKDQPDNRKTFSCTVLEVYQIGF